MSDDTSPSILPPAGGDGDDGGGHLLRWLVLIAWAIGVIVAGRRFALSSSDREFEERLRAADNNRD